MFPDLGRSLPGTPADYSREAQCPEQVSGLSGADDGASQNRVVDTQKVEEIRVEKSRRALLRRGGQRLSFRVHHSSKAFTYQLNMSHKET